MDTNCLEMSSLPDVQIAQYPGLSVVFCSGVTKVLLPGS